MPINNSHNLKNNFTEDECKTHANFKLWIKYSAAGMGLYTIRQRTNYYLYNNLSDG